MDDLNPRQREFVRALTKEMKPASHAYAQAYGGSPSDNSTRVKASQLLTNPNVVRTIEQLEETMHQEALEAYYRNKDLALDPKTPANVKNDINKRIQELGGLNPSKKLEVDDKREFKGLTDLQEILAAKGYEKKK